MRGPYSPALSAYAYANLYVLASNDFSDYKLAELAESNIQRVNGLETRKRPDFIVVSWYELLVSLLYIHNNRENWKIDGQDHSLFSALLIHKPQYDEEQCRYAFEVLGEEGFAETGS